MVDSLLSKLENKLSALSHRTAAKEFAKVVNTLAAAAKEDKLTLEEDKKKVADAESVRPSPNPNTSPNPNLNLNPDRMHFCRMWCSKKNF